MKAKLLLKLVINYIKFRSIYHFSKRKRDENRPVVYFDLTNYMLERVAAYLIYAFHSAGYRVFVKHRFSFISNLHEYGKYIARLPFLYLGGLPESNNVLYLTDRDINTSKYNSSSIISIDVLSDHAKKNPMQFLPFSMIPRLYYEQHYLVPDRLHNQRRHIRIFFSGNTDINQYNHEIFENYFNKLSRVSIIKTLKERLTDSCIIVNDFSSTLDKNLSDKLVILEWYGQSLMQKRLSGRTENETWLPTLSRSEFFLACPGFIQPMCHNLIESMSVGVIPIIEHPEFLNPALEHGKNCITFSGKDDLVTKVNEVLVMDASSVARMRLNVLEYYNQYLDLIAVTKWVKRMAENQNKIYVISSSYFIHQSKKLISDLLESNDLAEE